VSIHPYGADPSGHTNFDQNFDDILRIAETLWETGNSDVGLWVTEWGWGTPGVSEATQASRLEYSLDRLRDYCSRFVGLACYFLDSDAVPYTNGLYTDAYAAKTAATNFRAHAERTP
jgi:hypothetical protein